MHQNLLIRPITYKHDLSKDICSWIVESYVCDNSSITYIMNIIFKNEMDMLLLWNIYIKV